MISFPNCKINLGLRVIRKRSDGFHDIETVFYPLPFFDIVEAIRVEGDAVAFSNSGLTVPGDQKENLVVKAWNLLKKDFPVIGGIQFHLHKNIPMGAGLGGGSADGAYTLKLLNKKFTLGISNEKLMDYALQLGSDCPFFIINKPCIGEQRGEVLTPVTIDLSSYWIVLVNPGIAVSTAAAFAGINLAGPTKKIIDTIQQPVDKWKNELVNDFESPVFAQHPEIGKIKNDLYQQGAIYASMSGTGSTVFGLFEKEEPQIEFSPGYFVKKLRGQRY